MDQAEGLRSLVKMRNVRNVEHAKVLTITSGKGGVGKSNTAVNLAIQFRRMGKRVIIFDADFGLANVQIMFGVVPKHTLKDVIYGQMRMDSIIEKGPEGIGFISGGSGIVGLNDLRHDQIDLLVRSLGSLNRLTDVLIIDTGAGVSRNVMDFVLASPEVVLITTPEPSSLTDSYSLMKALYNHPKFVEGGTNVRLLANRVNSPEEANALYEKLNSVVSGFLKGKLEYLGMIPQDPALERAVRSQRIVSVSDPEARSSIAYAKTAKKLMEVKDGTRYRWGVTQLFTNFLKR